MSKKMIAPIVISVLIILYYFAYFAVLIYLLDGWLKWLLALIPAIISAAMIYVCIERITEIKGGEEDDLSEY